MSLNDFIFTSYCFDNTASGGDYHTQQIRLEQSIRAIYPQPNLHFIHEPEETGKPKFQQSLYGFKVQLVKECLQKGFKKIIFFDTAICLNDTVDYWLMLAKQYGILSIMDNQLLINVTSNKCLKYLFLSRDEISSWHLAGGSVYVFDFDVEICNKIFILWADLESKGLFGQQEDLSNGRLEGHRMDETCMALSFGINNMQPLKYDIMRYAYENPHTKEITKGHGEYKPIIIKRHFK